MHHVYLETVGATPDEIAGRLSEAFRWLGLEFQHGQYVVLKPNLTFPQYEPGVCTNPAFMEGIMIVLKDYGVRMTWVEGDGGNRSYTADEAFEGHGFDHFRRRYGVKTLNVCRGERVLQPMQVAGRRFSLPLPKMFVSREFDWFISVPVFKTHIFTTVSLGFKNLWGLIPDPLRMYYHYFLDWGIVGLVKALRPDAVFLDGTISLDREGPINGVAVPTNRMLVSGSPGAAESIGARVMKVDPERLRYFRFAQQEGLIPELSAIRTSRSVHEFQTHRFTMRRSFWASVSIWVSKFPKLQRVVYHSSLSPLIYFVVDRTRPSNRQALMRHGRWRAYV